MIRSFLSSNKWVYAAFLYPLSWVTYSGPNLSFLAWIAFVPLFIYQSTARKSFIRFFLPALIVTACWTSVTSGWLFYFPESPWHIGVVIISETIHISIPFVIFYFIQRAMNFDQTLWLLPFIWITWEWIYTHMPHVMSTHLLAYAQGNNLWLIQMSDIGGMWLVGFWVMMFNVIFYFTLKKHYYDWKSKDLVIAVCKTFALMIVPVLVYGLYSLNEWSRPNGKSLQVSIIPTTFGSEYLMNFQNQKKIIESTLRRTDSLAFELIKEDKGSDLYLWPESGTAFWTSFPNITSTLMEATNDWSGSLLTGCTGIPTENDNNEVYVSGVMISLGLDSKTNNIQHHHKTSLAPLGETLPYREFLLSFVDTSYAKRYNRVKGTSYEPLILKTRDDSTYSTGVSLCYEQWTPKSWTKQVVKGAEYFVHMAAEGWYGHRGFQQFMSNVTRFRAVENRRSVARSSNKGLSLFINAAGKTYGAIPLNSLGVSTSDVQTNSHITFFSRYPDVFPVGCLIVLFTTLFILILIDRFKK